MSLQRQPSSRCSTISTSYSSQAKGKPRRGDSRALREKCADARPSPAVDVNDEDTLNAVALGNEDQVVMRPQREKDASEVLYSKLVLRPVPVDNDSLASQGAADPLGYQSALPILCSPVEIAEVELTLYTSLLSSSSVSVPVMRVKPAKNHSCNVDGVNCGAFVESGLVGGNVEAEKVLDGGLEGEWRASRR
jgi:hypothetical protein